MNNHPEVYEIPGLETIRGLVGEPPPKIPVDKDTMMKQQMLMQEWNPVFIAVIPFCYKCKVPLVWHTPPKSNTIFHCPQCGRIWVKGEWPESQNKNGENKNGNS